MRDGRTTCDRSTFKEKRRNRTAGWASLPKRVCRRAVREVRELLQGGGRGEAPEELTASYRERLACQRDIYGQWIREREPLLWRQWEGTLEGGREREACRKSCLVISYGELAGVTELSRIVNAGNADSQGEERMPDILLFAEEPEDLDERAVPYVEEWFGRERDARLLYGAEDHREGKARRFPWFKPCFSPDTLLGFFYFGSYFAVDAGWAAQTRLAGYEDARRNLYDFVLRLLQPYYREKRLAAWDKGYKEIACTDLVLYHRSDVADFRMSGDADASRYFRMSGDADASRYSGTPEGADASRYFRTPGDADASRYSGTPEGADASRYSRTYESAEPTRYFGEMRGATNAEFWGYEKEYVKCRQHLMDSVCGSSEPYQTLHPDVWSLIPAAEEGTEDGAPLVSVVIPSRDHPKLLKKCIGSFLERTVLPGLREKVEFIVVDNGSEEKNRRIIGDFLASAGILYHYLYRPMEFNFSAMCNMGVAQAGGKWILLLNDDIEIVEENWLRILLGQAGMPGTGAVGAKLRYPDGNKIQHAGVTNMSAGPSHKLMAFPDDRCYYYGHNTVSYDMIAVTGACLLVEKSVYEEAGGLDEEMAVAYNDVDFCFTLTEAGLRNVVRNDALLLHHESASRGLDGESAEKWQRLSEEKERLYAKHPLFAEWDPYYGGQLAGDTLDYHVRGGDTCERSQAEVRRRDGKAYLQKRYSGLMMLTIDQVKSVDGDDSEETTILEAEGWCYMAGWDNCLFERHLILEAEREDFYYQISVRERFRPDVEAALPGQKNIELSGFVCDVDKENLIPGSYKVGMLYRNVCGGRLFYGRSNKRLQVSV